MLGWAQFLARVQLEIAPVTVGERASVGRACCYPGDRAGRHVIRLRVRLTRFGGGGQRTRRLGPHRHRQVAAPGGDGAIAILFIPVVNLPGADLGVLDGRCSDCTEGIFNIHGAFGACRNAFVAASGDADEQTVLVLIYLITNSLVDLPYAAPWTRGSAMAEHHRSTDARRAAPASYP